MQKCVKMSQKVRRNLIRNWRALIVFNDFNQKAKKCKEIYLKLGMKVVKKNSAIADFCKLVIGIIASTLLDAFS